MKKALGKILLVFGASAYLALVSCSLFYSQLAPPSWIQGTWTDNQSRKWTFTEDDAINQYNSDSISYKNTKGYVDTMNDKTYSIEWQGGGTLLEKNTFTQEDGTWINWNINSNKDIAMYRQ